MFDELLKTVKAQLYERVGSPLLGSFLLSWIGWNYKFPLVLMSSVPVLDKFVYIDSVLYPSLYEVLGSGFSWPLLTATAFIVIYPIPARWAYQYWHSRQRELKEIRQRIDDEAPMSKEEARELRRAAARASAEFDEELKRRNQEIADLRALVNEIAPAAESAVDATEALLGSEAAGPLLEGELSDEQIQLLQFVSNNPGIAMRQVVSNAPTPSVVTEYNVDELARQRLVTANIGRNRAGGSQLQITPAGRALLVKQFKKNGRKFLEGPGWVAPKKLEFED